MTMDMEQAPQPEFPELPQSEADDIVSIYNPIRLSSTSATRGFFHIRRSAGLGPSLKFGGEIWGKVIK